MSELCRQYISDVRNFFPIMGKKEREYLKKLSLSVEEYCEEKSVKTVEELYDGVGSPSYIVNTYFSLQDTSEIIKRISLSNWLKRGIPAIFVIALIGLCAYGVYLWQVHELLVQEHEIIDLINKLAN